MSAFKPCGPHLQALNGFPHLIWYSRARTTELWLWPPGWPWRNCGREQITDGRTTRPETSQLRSSIPSKWPAWCPPLNWHELFFPCLGAHWGRNRKRYLNSSAMTAVWLCGLHQRLQGRERACHKTPSPGLPMLASGVSSAREGRSISRPHQPRANPSRR